MKPVRAAFGYLALLAASAGVLALLLQGGPAGPEPAAAPAGSAFDALRATIAGNLHHPLSHLFVQLIVVIGAALVAGRMARGVGLPAVVGEMAAGILLGPSLLGHVAPEVFAFVFPADSLGALRLFSQIGICLFMFAVGMELRPETLRHRVHAAVAVSHASILVPFVLGVGLAVALYDTMAGPAASFRAFALFMGISLSITAFPVLARILQERGLAATPLGSAAIACAAVDDVTAWSIMAFVVAVSRAGSLGGAALTLVLVLAFVAAMLFGVRRLLPRWLDLGTSEPSHGTLATVLLVVLTASLCTEVVGVHALFGAFLAGVVMPDAHGFREGIRVRVEKFSGVLLVPLFFAYTGLRTEIGLLAGWHDLLVCTAIVGLATLGKLGATAVAARWTGMGWAESLQLGALMNTRGLMELIALNIGYDLGILSPRIFTMLVLMALVTTVMTGPLLNLFGARGGPASRR